MTELITRNLEDGPDYAPDWRHKVVLEYLKVHADSGGTQSWEKLLENERDVVVRQVIRYHLNAGCLICNSVRYAIRCQQQNGITGLASSIRAMVVAGFTFDEISAELKTSRRNILVFCWLYFDAERYLDYDVWLQSLLLRDFCPGDSAARSRDRRLLRIAFNEGREGLARALSPRRRCNPEDAQALGNQVRHAVAARALEYVQNLDEDGVPTGPEDFNRHLMVSSSFSRDHQPGEEGNLQAKVQAWFLEAGERGVFPLELIKMGMGLKDDDYAFGGGRRRSLQVASSFSDRMNGEGSTGAGTDHEAEVAKADVPINLQKVELTSG